MGWGGVGALPGLSLPLGRHYFRVTIRSCTTQDYFRVAENMYVPTRSIKDPKEIFVRQVIGLLKVIRV